MNGAIDRQPRNLPREQLMAAAEEVLKRYHPHAEVLFKFTCGKCGARCTLREPNVLYEKGECFSCGHETVITEGGFTLVLHREGGAPCRVN